MLINEFILKESIRVSSLEFMSNETTARTDATKGDLNRVSSIQAIRFIVADV